MGAGTMERGLECLELDSLRLSLHLQVMKQQKFFVGSPGAQEMGSLCGIRESFGLEEFSKVTVPNHSPSTDPCPQVL